MNVVLVVLKCQNFDKIWIDFTKILLMIKNSFDYKIILVSFNDLISFFIKPFSQFGKNNFFFLKM